GTWIGEGIVQDQATIDTSQEIAREGLSEQLEKFAENTMEYMLRERDLLLDGIGAPGIRTNLAGRPVLIVVRGYHYKEDLATLRPFLRENRPVIIGVDGGADAVLDAGFRPDMIIGDMDSVSDRALRSGAELVVHAYRDGRAPGLERLERLGLGDDTILFPASGTSEDIAMLMADEEGASVIVAVGTHGSLEEFLDRGRAGMSSTFLTRLRVGSKLVDAKGVSRLYRQRISTFQLALLALAGLAALAVALWATPGGQALVQILGARLDGMLSWFTTLFAPRPSGSEEGTENVIDFRYHLVSLISVFLALAVGIVLGAGPLRENLGDQLAGQVEQLRTEQDQLRSQADELGIQNDQLASFITEIGPDLVADTLPGNDIAILTDDSSTRPATERTSELLEEAGAQSVTRVDLQPALWEPDEDDRRTEAISAISAIAPGALDTELEGSEQLSAVIVTLLAPAAEDSDLDPELRAQIWQILVDHQLVTLTGDMPPQVDGVIFASAAPEDLAEESEDDTAATER